MAACSDEKICVFDFNTDYPLGSPIALTFEPEFICLSPDSKYVFTSGCDTSKIQSFDVKTNTPHHTYN